MKLFSFPYAGGGSAIFNKWQPHLDKRIQLQAVELSGRGRRIYDPLYDSIDEAVDDVYRMIESQLGIIPYAIYGHSLGGIIGFELVRKIRRLGRPEPVHLFISGRGAPHIPDEDEPMFHRLTEDEFKKEIMELGGTPREFFEHPELLEVLLPTLKNDFKIAELYQRPAEIEPLPYDISVFLGKEEEVSARQVHGWREWSEGLCSIYYFEGEHFFINQFTSNIAQIISRTMLDR